MDKIDIHDLALQYEQHFEKKAIVTYTPVAAFRKLGFAYTEEFIQWFVEYIKEKKDGE